MLHAAYSRLQRMMHTEKTINDNYDNCSLLENILKCNLFLWWQRWIFSIIIVLKTRFLLLSVLNTVMLLLLFLETVFFFFFSEFFDYWKLKLTVFGASFFYITNLPLSWLNKSIYFFVYIWNYTVMYTVSVKW